MALEFRQRHFRLPGRKGQFFLAFLALAAVIAIVAAWVIVRYHTDRAPEQPDNSSQTSDPVPVYSKDDVKQFLWIFSDEEQPRFILIQLDPTAPTIRVVPVPANLAVDETNNLAAVYRKSGAAKVANIIETWLQLPVRHYVSATGDQTESWFNHLENGLVIQLPEAVDFTDITGARVRLPADERNLTAAQAVSLLRYTGWKTPDQDAAIGVQLVAAMFNQYLKSGRYLSNDFSSLANLTKTSLRVGDFNAAQELLQFLAAQNTGNICQTLTIPGVTEDGLFRPDDEALRQLPIH